MLELICHHTYDTWGGLAVDRSPHASNGAPIGAVYRRDGAHGGSGALDLGTDPAHKILVPRRRAWQDLGAIRVEMRVRIDGGGTGGAALGNRVLMDADDSFRLRAAQFLGLLPDGSLGFVHVLAARIADPNEDDGHIELICASAPFNRWATVGFDYDGLRALRLLVDGQVVAEGEISSPLRPVGPAGVAIGGPIGPARHNHPLVVDEVRVWRRDPDEIRRVFLSRPLPPGAADCWERAFRALAASWEADPQRASRQREAVRAVVDMLRRRIAASGSADEHDRLHERYRELWSTGALDSDEMEDVFRSAAEWWRRNGGDPSEDPDLLGSIVALGPPPDDLDLSCDPELSALLERIRRALGS